MLQHSKLLSLFSFFVNKNLFLERVSFLKGFKVSTQNIIYSIYFVFSKYIVWGIIFGLWYFLKWPTIFLSLFLILYLCLKLVLLDIDDWQLYFRDDICLAIPEQQTRYITILLNILIYKFFVADNILIYMLVLKLTTPVISWLSLLFITIAYMAVSALVLSLYLVLKVGSLKLKAIYSILSYLSAMLAMFIVGHIIIKGISHIANLIYSLLLGAYKFNPDDFINGITLSLNNLFSNNNFFILISIIAIVTSILGILLVYCNKNLEMQDIQPNLHMPKPIQEYLYSGRKDDLQQSLSLKEYKLIIDIYKYNFKQYYFTFFMDRPYAILIALIINFAALNLNCRNLLFFGLSIILFITEIGSIMGNKLIANLSFITDYNTLRQLNCNGISIQELSDSKLRLFYKVRFIPTFIFAATIIAGHVAIGSSIFLILINIIFLLIIFLVYPRDYFTRNLICTRMDYKDYESYLTEKNILEGGVDDFSPLNWLYNTMLFSVIVLSIASFIFPELSIYTMIACIGIFIVGILVCHTFMKKIYRNIISFIERGDYSADFSKIFKNDV